MEGDPRNTPGMVELSSFQSTPSAWRETFSADYMTTATAISIHSLRMEGDATPAYIAAVCFGISIHSLRMEGDLLVSQLVLFRCHFNPLPPHGGRRNLIMKKIDVIFISIHSLRMEGDGKFSSKSGRGQLFQSTPSAWRETV